MMTMYVVDCIDLFIYATGLGVCSRLQICKGLTFNGKKSKETIC